MKERPEKIGRGPVSTAGLSQGLPRAEWDFSGCPEGRELDCWAYELTREMEWAVNAYAAARREAESGAPGKCGFDAEGVWHVLGKGPRCTWEVGLQPGFPETPYLRTDMRVSVVQRRPHIYEIWNPPFGEHGELKAIFGKRVAGFKLKWERVSVNWDFSDKRIRRDFDAWLERNRPRKARLGSGRSKAREKMKELKALGAYRLMKTMTAGEALAWTKRCMPYGLYAKIPDWYEARSMAAELLSWFLCDQVAVRSFARAAKTQAGKGESRVRK